MVQPALKSSGSGITGAMPFSFPAISRGNQSTLAVNAEGALYILPA